MALWNRYYYLHLLQLKKKWVKFKNLSKVKGQVFKSTFVTPQNYVSCHSLEIDVEVMKMCHSHILQTAVYSPVGLADAPLKSKPEFIRISSKGEFWDLRALYIPDWKFLGIVQDVSYLILFLPSLSSSIDVLPESNLIYSCSFLEYISFMSNPVFVHAFWQTQTNRDVLENFTSVSIHIESYWKRKK